MTNLILILVLAGLLICLLCTGCRVLPWGWLGLVELILTNLSQVVVDTITESLSKGCNLDGRSIKVFTQFRIFFTSILWSWVERFKVGQVFDTYISNWKGLFRRGGGGCVYYPVIVCFFLFIVFLNILGLFSYVFTPTAHLAVTLGISYSIVMGITVSGWIQFGADFLSILMPRGAPMGLAPFLVLVEVISYAARAISLGVRLAANIIAGHLLFTIMSGFVLSMPGVTGILPVGVLIFIAVLEIGVAIVQAYVFCLLIIIYLRDCTT